MKRTQKILAMSEKWVHSQLSSFNFCIFFNKHILIEYFYK